MRFSLLFIPVISLLLVTGLRAEPTEELVKQGEAALAEGQAEKALALAQKAIAQSHDDPAARLLLGKSYELLGRHREAIEVYDRVLKADPKAAEIYDRRGSEHFKLGHIAESLADFDRYLELRPDRKPHHWKRGISCYYARKFEEGARQFEGYQQVDSNDVENAVWRYLCQVHTLGADKAREDMLPIGNDRRVPMMQVYALFCGKAKTEDVLAAVAKAKPGTQERRVREFMANLYLGLYYESAGDAKQAMTFLQKAADDAATGGYMGDVARVHVELRKKEVR